MDFLTALTLTLGIGTCNPTGAWCPGQELGATNTIPGVAALTATLVESESTRWRVDLAATHYSNVVDNEWLRSVPFTRGDRGQEFFTLSINYKLYCRNCK